MSENIVDSSRIETIHDFDSKIMQSKRNIFVYLPKGYDQNSDKKYPVVYMHVGQRVFPIIKNQKKYPSWHVEKAMDRLIDEGAIEPAIVVGISYLKAAKGDRYKMDYLYPVPEIVKHYHRITPNSVEYEEYMVKELVPMIEEKYRTLDGPENRMLIGSSAGALSSYHIGLNNTDIFGGVGMMSPSVKLPYYLSLFKIKIPFSSRWMKTYKDFSETGGVRLWVDIGDKEKELPVSWIEDFVQEMEGVGFQQGKDLKFHVEEGAVHREKDWGARIDKVLVYFLGKDAEAATAAS